MKILHYLRFRLAALLFVQDFGTVVRPRFTFQVYIVAPVTA
jgi:hypothetical protein